VLDTFNFQNLVIWNDLEKNVDLIKDSPFVKLLAGGSSEDDNFFVDFDDVDLNKVKAENNMCIYETDSSQLETICRARRGKAL
jgi:hypothetical protein